MPGDAEGLAERAGSLCRAAAAALIAGLWRGRSVRQIHDEIARRTPGEQAAIVGAVAVLLLALNIAAAHFGLLGLAALWIVIIVLVN